MVRDLSDRVGRTEGRGFAPVIKVVGLGGAGSNAVDRMITVGIPGVEYIIANTDRQALAQSDASVRLQLGPRSTRGLGAGGKAEVGREAALESKQAIRDALAGADLVFVAAGMGGGTGTGSAPVVAQIARECGALTVAVVTTPFTFEGSYRARTAQAGLHALSQHVHTLIEVRNDQLLEIAPRDLRLEVAFRVADDVLRQGIMGIVELVTQAGMINLDFASVSEVIQQGGRALMAIGQGNGSNKVAEATEAALHHPLLDSDSMERATAVLVHMTGGPDMGLMEVNQAMSDIVQAAHPTAEVLFGASEDADMEGRVQVILIATGIKSEVPDAIAVQSLFGVPAPVSEPITERPDRTSAPDPVDVPAFIRRRELFGRLPGNGAQTWMAD